MKLGLPAWAKPGVIYRDESGLRAMHVIWEVRALVDDRVIMRRRTAAPGSGWLYVCEDEAFFQSRATALRIVREPSI